MMKADQRTGEAVTFLRTNQVPGLELMVVARSARTWRCFNDTDYGVTFLNNWTGNVVYRKRQSTAQAGSVFLSMPGETHSAAPESRQGDFCVLLTPAAVFVQHVREMGGKSLTPAWRCTLAEPSPILVQRFGAIASAIARGASTLEVQSMHTAFVACAARELLELPPRTPTEERRPLRVVERVRETLHEDLTGSVTLEELATDAGLSRYQLLRLFKRHYGLPPHTYQIRVRLARARRLLAAGSTAAEVAAALHFADQSHLARHFRQQWGVTPFDYMRSLKKTPDEQVPPTGHPVLTSAAPSASLRHRGSVSPPVARTGEHIDEPRRTG